jgi:hypothetical protein
LFTQAKSMTYKAGGKRISWSWSKMNSDLKSDLKSENPNLLPISNYANPKADTKKGRP